MIIGLLGGLGVVVFAGSVLERIVPTRLKEGFGLRLLLVLDSRVGRTVGGGYRIGVGQGLHL